MGTILASFHSVGTSPDSHEELYYSRSRRREVWGNFAMAS